MADTVPRLGPARRAWSVLREDPLTQVLRLRLHLVLLLVLGHVVSAVMVIALVVWVIPGPSMFQSRFTWITFLAAPLFLGALVAVGLYVAANRVRRDVRWFSEGEVPDQRDQRLALALPWRLAALQVALWVVGTCGVTAMYGSVQLAMVPKIALPSFFGAAGVCTWSYVLGEYIMRPVAAAALAGSPARRTRVTGVAGRSILSWTLANAAPVLGLMTACVMVMAGYHVTVTRFAVTVFVLLAVVMVGGLVSIVLTTVAFVEPIHSIREAMRKVERGDLTANVEVFDGTEFGELQAGFNSMAQGLRDRERMREVFGRHVGQDVAERALAEHPQLGGEDRVVAVFFIDLVGSTTMAAQTHPEQIVSLLNRFFDVIVDEVDRHGGLVNKFVGDAAMAVFGAPNAMADPAGESLAAARTIMQRLEHEVPQCTAAIGVSYGHVVAGNVGAHERYEYTVIGDAVNEAARLSELAKSLPGRIVASAAALDAATPDESRRWQFTESVLLRGRLQETTLAIPD